MSEVIQTVGGCLENYDSDRAARQVLLVDYIRVHGDQHIKSSFRKAQKFILLRSRPSRFLDSEAFVSVIW